MAPRRRARTRIIGTLGPATCTPGVLRRMISAGLDVVRLNFSHGTHDEHRELFEMVRAVSAELGEPVGVLQDLCGPKLRLGRLAEGELTLRVGEEVVVREHGGIGQGSELPIETGGVMSGVGKGQAILLGDGMIELVVTRADKDSAHCRVVHGGTVRSRQGFHLPGARLVTHALTAKDREDLAFGLELGVDAVALSFVSHAEDVRRLRRSLQRRGKRPFVVAKIERAAALEDLPAILDVCSGVMVARGDLGVEIGTENVPLAQKRIIREAMKRHRPVITATQMLESMIERPTATRAEVSDVANAVLEGSDALMLSGETAIGRYPVQAVKTLSRVARSIEASREDEAPIGEPTAREDATLAAARAARVMARAVEADAIVGFTNTGRTVRLLSSQRPTRLIVGASSRPSTVRRMKFFWGVEPMLIPEAASAPEMIASAEDEIMERKIVRRGGTIVLVTGEGVTTGATNTVKVHSLGAARDALARQNDQRRRRGDIEEDARGARVHGRRQGDAEVEPKAAKKPASGGGARGTRRKPRGR